jgi:F-type H+-transporting ATPase subunit b
MSTPRPIRHGCVVAGDSPASCKPVRCGKIVRNSTAILASLFFMGLLLVAGNAAQAQANASSSSEEPATMNAELAKESREAAGEEQDQFKHSASVQLVAKLTGLSLEHAYWLCVFFNFAVVAGTVVYFSKKNLPNVFRNRTASIQQAMQEARQASEDANRRLSEIETRLSRLGSEIAAMGAAAEKEAIAEEARIKAAAEEDARKIVESAEQEIAAAAKLARRELTAYAANLAVSLAAKQMKVDVATDQALVREFAKELSPKNPNGGSTKAGQDGE